MYNLCVFNHVQSINAAMQAISNLWKWLLQGDLWIVRAGSSRFKRALEIWSLSLQVHPGSACSSQARCCSHAFRSSFSAQGCLSMPWGFFNLKHGAERRWESGVFIDVYSAWRVFEMFGYVWYRSTWSRLQFLQGTAKCRGQGGVVSWCPHHRWSSLVIVTKTWSMITTMCHDVWRCVMCLYFGSQTLSLCRGFRCITLFCFQIGICE